VPRFFTEHEYAVVDALADMVIAPGDGHPGGRALGVVDFVDNLLGAFTVDPPLIYAGGPFSGRAGGDASFGNFFPLSRNEELAWRTRIEGSRGLPEREFNGAVQGYQEIYRDGIAALGTDFLELNADARLERFKLQRELRTLFYEHACEGAYAAPEYGGNRGGAGWHAIQFPGDVQPRGYTDEEVSGRA
jgi:hypothetical protein